MEALDSEIAHHRPVSQRQANAGIEYSLIIFAEAIFAICPAIRY